MVEGQTQSVEVEPGAPVAKQAPASARATSRATDAPPPQGGGLGTMRIAGLAVAGAGVVGLGVAVATGLILPGKKSTVDAHCDANKQCDAEGYDAAQAGQTLSTINTVAWIAGGLATGVGATLFLLGDDDEPDAALTVGPWPGGAGASLRARF
jgi:hypothetical protein